MSLEDDFKAAAQRSRSLANPGNDVLLQLYSLYKQGSEGDVHGEEPGMFDFVGKAKYDAWAGRRGMAREDAMRAYIELVKSLGGA